MLQPSPATQAPGARCASHGDRPASIICTRCGSYACDLCRNEGADGLEYCGRCVPTVSVLADRGARFAANLVDQLVVFLPWFVAILLGVFLTGAGTEGSSAVALLLLGFLVMLGMCGLQLYLVAQHGQSIGKRLLGIRVVRGDGSRADLFRILVLRNLVPLIINFGCGLFSLVDALFIFNEDRRCLHDVLADTKVVKLNEHTR